MNLFKKYFLDLFLTNRFYQAAIFCAVVFGISFFVPGLFEIAKVLFFVFLFLVFIDYIILFFFSKMPKLVRKVAERLSNGDESRVELLVRNIAQFPLITNIIDELPFQFQERKFEMKKTIQPGKTQKFIYSIRPTERGIYEFGSVNIFSSTILQFVSRRERIALNEEIKVYPAFQNFQNLQLAAVASQQTSGGQKRMRRIGQSMEFEQIKEYVSGDDIRTINWKATARKGGLMVNNFEDERSQQVYAIVDKGRLMKMPFSEMTLLDYAINATLALAHISLGKQDKFGLITFNNKIDSIVSAEKKPSQRELIMQALFKEQTSFKESDFELLYLQIRQKIKQRSLLLLFTNFESMSGLQRQLPYLRSIAKYHLLLVIFFENTELSKVAALDVDNIEDIYTKTIADKLVIEKKTMIKELAKYGIQSLQCKPEELTISTLNKYLELKAKQAI